MAEITLNNIEKSNWKPFPFEKIAKRISESVDPNKTELEVYIGLEHLDAETIHIRRHGSPADVNGGKLKCYPGDVIFGKRRAYQRKAGIVTQEGICSAHSFVFRANDEVIDVKLFPFFMHSDQFMHRMVDISVGGLSPTINWSDLKHQEFFLPPKEQQAELAELLWAMDTVIEKDLAVLERLEVLFQTKLKTLLLSESTAKLKEICNIKSGDTAPQDNEAFYEGEYPFVRMQHISTNIKGYTAAFDYLNEVGIKKLKLYPKNSILIPKSGESIRSENKVILDRDAYIVNHLAILYNFSVNYNFKFIYYYLQRFKLSSLINQTSMPSLNLSEIGEINVPDLNYEKQEIIVKELDEIIEIKESSKSKLQSSKALQKALINQIF